MRLQRGTEIIKRFWATLPNAPGVYRMLDARSDVLYVGKAKSLKSRVGSYARGQAHSNRIARMIGETASMEFVTTATEMEALLLEANLIKQLQAPLQRADAGRQVAPLHPPHRRSRGAADRQASRREEAQGRLLRPVRERLGGEPHDQRAAAGLPAALVQRQLLREPHAPLPALPDQALLGTVHEGDLARRVPEARRGGAGLPGGQVECREGAHHGRDAGGGGRARIRAGGSLSRPACPRSRRSRACRGSTRNRSRRRTCSPSTSRRVSSASRCSSSGTGRTGATVPTSRRRTGRWRRTKCSPPSWPSSTTTSRRRASCCSRTRSRMRN